MVVGHDGDQAARDRQLHELADHRLIARILAIHRHGHIGQHGFGARGGHHDMVAAIGQRYAIGQRIAEVPEMALNFLRFHLKVGNRGLQLGVPVDQTLVAIDQPLIVEVHEDLHHRAGEMRVHGELLAAPVHRAAEATQLAGDRAAALRLPFPDLLDKGLAGVIGALVLTGFHLALDHHLRGDARMVGAHHPQRVLAAQALVTDHDVLQRVVQRMADMQAARDVGRRVDDGEGRGIGARGAEQTALFPMGIPLGLDPGGVEGLVERERVLSLAGFLGHAGAFASGHNPVQGPFRAGGTSGGLHAYRFSRLRVHPFGRHSRVSACSHPAFPA
jgi:hypothetical protein